MARKSEETIKTDNEIGLKIKELRISKGLSRQQLALKIGVTHQQLQKYEMGINRISAGRLKIIANELGKTISYFYDEEMRADVASIHSRISIEMQRNLAKLPFKLQTAFSNAIRIAAEG